VGTPASEPAGRACGGSPARPAGSILADVGVSIVLPAPVHSAVTATTPRAGGRQSSASGGRHRRLAQPFTFADSSAYSAAWVALEPGNRPFGIVAASSSREATQARVGGASSYRGKHGPAVTCRSLLVRYRVQAVTQQLTAWKTR